MKRTATRLIALVPVAVVTAAAWAHDPSEHATGVQEPDCTVMKGMDHADTEAEDPLMRALMQQCASARPDGSKKDAAPAGSADDEHGDRDRPVQPQQHSH